MNTSTSSKLFADAQKQMPGGVNSPVRAFKSVGRDPLYIARAKGSKIYDVDGNEFIDYVGSWGPMILGHAHARVIEAIKLTAENGTSFGACCEQELQLASLVKKFVPSIEIIRMVNSGTEATMSAIRLARAFTGRDKIIKFEGCYHGHGDSFLIKAGSGVATLGLPESPGVTKSIAKDTLTARFNDFESVVEAIEKNRGDVAAIFIEPVGGNMGCVPADRTFLSKLRNICDAESILLIFDEVMTGFRLARGGAQEIYGIRPDLTTFGKVVGGGLPVGAYGGRAEIMSLIAPAGPVYQAGTFSGNPVAMAAGIETLRVIDEDTEFYSKLESTSAKLADGLLQAIAEKDLNYTVNRTGSMLTVFFTDITVTDFDTAKRSDTKAFASFFQRMIENGVYLPPSQFESMFVSAAHTPEDIERTISVFSEALV